MKTITRLLLGLCAVFVICTSCTNKGEEPPTRVENDTEAFSQYWELSEKPMISALDIALRKVTPPEGNDYIVCLTDNDVRFLCSLDAKDLIKIKTDIMRNWGFSCEEECYAIIDECYEKMCEGMDDEELMRFNKFINEYIEMPIGRESLEQFDAFNNCATSYVFSVRYAYAAIGIDNFGRKLFENLDSTTRSAAYCKRIFGIRVAITSVGMICGWMLPGPGWALAAVAATAVFDTAGATADYFNCLKTRTE